MATEKTTGKISGGENYGNSSQKQKYQPWERFSNWIHCICIVTFDLELGQAMEVHLTL